MKQTLKEKTFRIESKYYNARFWIAKENYDIKLYYELTNKFHELNNSYKGGDAEAIADYFCQRYNINAVEVTTKYGTGDVHYVDWP